MTDDSLEYPIDTAITRLNDNIRNDEQTPTGSGGLYISENYIHTYYNGSEGRTPRMWQQPQLWDDIAPGDVDLYGHSHPVRFLIVHKGNQNLSPYEKLNALSNLGIDHATTLAYGLVRYTDDWHDTGGGELGNLPLTLTRTAIIDLVLNVTDQARQTIQESLQQAQLAATSSANSSAIAQEAAEKALISYGGYTRLMPVENYLYEIWYNTLDYTYAFNYFSTQDIEPNVGGCTAVRSGSIYGRNYDWTYDDKAEFLVHTSALDGRHAVLGMATNIPDLTDEFVKSLLPSELYKLVPFRLVDGMNDAGLVMNVNVVPVLDSGDPYKNRHINYSPDHKITLCLSMLIRFVLDNFSTVDEAIDYITDNVNLYYSTPFLRDHGYEYHYLIADKFGTTKCIEFKDAEISAFSCQDHPYITNFHVEGVEWNVSGKAVNTPVDGQKPGTINLVEDYGAGLERINIIAAGYHAAEDDVEEMKHLMQSVFYSRAYDGNKWELPTPNTRWYTEFVDDYHKYGLDLDLTVNDDPDDFAGVIEYWDQLFVEKQRTGMDRPVWQTTHSIVYDMEKLLAHLYVLEADPLKSVDTLDDDYYIAAIERALGAIDIDPEPEPASRNAVASGGVYAKLQTKQDILASVNAGLNISIQESLSTYKPLIHAAQFNGELDNNLHIGNGSEGLRASCLLGIGNPTSGGSFYVKNTADPSPVYVTLENLAPPFPPETRTILDLVDILNDNNTFSRDAEASVYSEHFIKITSKLIGEAGNSFVYKADTQYTTEEQPEPILHPCFGMGEVQQGSLIPGRNGSVPGYASCLLHISRPTIAGLIKNDNDEVLLSLSNETSKPYSAFVPFGQDTKLSGTFEYIDYNGYVYSYYIAENNEDRLAVLRLETLDGHDYGNEYEDTWVFYRSDDLLITLALPILQSRTAAELVQLLNSNYQLFSDYFIAYVDNNTVMIKTIDTGFDLNLWKFYSSGGIELKLALYYFSGGSNNSERSIDNICYVLSFVFSYTLLFGAAVDSTVNVTTYETGIKTSAPVLNIRGLLFALDLTITMSGAANDRTTRDIVNYINNTPLAVQNLRATAEYINTSNFRLKAELPGSLYNDIVYYNSGCFGSTSIQLGSEVKGYDAQSPTNYDLTVNGVNVLLDTTPEHIALIDHTVLKHNRVYELARNVTTTGGEDWTVQPGATAEIYIDCSTAAYNVIWPLGWIWGSSNIFKASLPAAALPELALGTVTCVSVRRHGNATIAYVEYVIDNN